MSCFRCTGCGSSLCLLDFYTIMTRLNRDCVSETINRPFLSCEAEFSSEDLTGNNNVEYVSSCTL